MTQSVKIEESTKKIQSLGESRELTALRLEAVEKFSTLEIPQRDIEAWRKIHLKDIDLSAFSPLESDSSLDAKVESGSNIDIIDMSSAIKEPAIKDAINKHYSEVIGSMRCDIFRCMNMAFFKNAIVVHAKKSANGRVKITHRPGKGNSVAHLVFLILDEVSEVTVIEEFLGNGESDKQVMWIPTTEVILSESSVLKYVEIRDFGESDMHFRHLTADQQGRGSVFHAFPLHRGGINGKDFYVSKINCPESEFIVRGIGFGEGHQFCDFEMHAEHFASNTISNILYKTVLKDRAHSVFDGNLVIPRGLKNVDALQVNNNILLDKKARAESMPRLVTMSENVQCEHGATVGELDPESIFFLTARGIPEDEARSLLIQGFVSEIIKSFPLADEEKETLEESILKKIR
jgi:Fe-S cluster assembly scaffold protein SufB